MKTREAIIKEVLDEYIGSQINIDSDTARDILAKRIANRLEYLETEDEFWESINEDI